MAKKNSSKTATEKSIQASEPRVITYKGWQGVNYVDAPLTWEPLEDTPVSFRQTDLPNNYLMVQNNLITTDTLGLETRQDSVKVGDIENVPEYSDHDWVFTGVTAIYKHWLFCVVSDSNHIDTSNCFEKIAYRDLLVSPETWMLINMNVFNQADLNGYEIKEIGFFESNLVVMVRDYNNEAGFLALAKVETSNDDGSISINGMNWTTGEESLANTVCDTPKICPARNRPSVTPRLIAKGGMNSNYNSATDNAPIRVDVKFCYTNRLGSTLTHEDDHIGTIFVELSPAFWTAKKFVRIRPRDANGNNIQETREHTSVTGIDFYGRDTENLNWVFIGHINVTPDEVTNGTWKYDWYGNMTDISQWLNSQLLVPTDNTTHGPDATYFNCHDSRMYYWGMPSKPYRLWIGGNPGAEFSIARGLGGAWVDIEPGSGYDIQGTEKWKTVSGANIVTILCGNRNTTKVKRFNLVETNLTLTNEISYKSYMYEEVSNVVGCNSRWGHGVFSDGLYSLNRYGLMLTTMAMEYNSQMKNQKMSEAIDPIFTNILGKYLRDGRMVCIDDIIYIAFSDEDTGYLDNVILCYDINLKTWYTMTHDQTIGDGELVDDDHILHIFAIDSDEYQEGLGTITENEVRLYPVTGSQDVSVPEFPVLVETGELAPRQPMQAYWYLHQLELRFDYLICWPEETDDHPGPATVLIEGVDYYGRYFVVEKKLNKKARSWQTWNDNGAVVRHQIVGGESWEAPAELRNHTEWIRIDKMVQSFRIRIKGHARFRLTHINAKIYQQADTIGTPYGFDAQDTYYNQKHPEGWQIHHYIDDYNNLRRAVIS